MEVAHRLADGEDISTMTNIRGTAVNLPAEPEGYTVIDSSRIEKPRKEAFVPKNPYEVETQCDTKKKSLLHSQSRFVHHVMMQRTQRCAYQPSKNCTTTAFFMPMPAVFCT